MEARGIVSVSLGTPITAIILSQSGNVFLERFFVYCSQLR